MNFRYPLTSFRWLIDGNAAFHADKSAGNKIVMHNMQRREKRGMLHEKRKQAISSEKENAIFKKGKLQICPSLFSLFIQYAQMQKEKMRKLDFKC